MTRDQRIAHRVRGNRPAHEIRPDVLLFGKRFVTRVRQDRPGWTRIDWEITKTGRTGHVVVEDEADIATWELEGSPWTARED